MNSRALAARAVAQVLAGASLDDALAAARRHCGERDLPLIKSMAYGVLREHAQLQAFANALLERPLDREPEIQSLIEVGFYQLRRMRIPAHAAVADTVAAAAVLDRPRMGGLVNALLRRFLRERDALEAGLPADAATRHSFPDWLVDRIQADWADLAETVLAESNAQAPLVLRVNRRRCDRDAYLAELQRAGLTGSAVDGLADAIALQNAVPVEKLPGFSEGLVSVQDASAQLMAGLLDLQDGLSLLDACAAPGGKTAHALEVADLKVTALDIDRDRLSRVHDNLRRLGLSATVKAADAARPSTWWDEQPFDRILVDAPCSGTGVIRRHPDIRWLRRVDDFPRFADRQLRLLTALWPLLAPGGVLVYATCSIARIEGEEVMRQFLQRIPDAKHEPIEAAWGQAQRLGRRIAPEDAFDGFYYARLRKPAKRVRPLATPVTASP